jgi:hypothetical protein
MEYEGSLPCSQKPAVKMLLVTKCSLETFRNPSLTILYVTMSQVKIFDPSRTLISAGGLYLGCSSTKHIFHININVCIIGSDFG